MFEGKRWPPVPDAKTCEDVADLLARRDWVDGPVVEALEAKLAEMVGARHAVAFNSCTSAIHAALACHGVFRGVRTAMPSLTFAGTATGAQHLDLMLCWQDVNPVTLTMDPRSTDNSLGKTFLDVDMIVAVDLHGVPHDLPRTRFQNIPVITDSCQSLGTLIDDKPVGSQGVHRWSFSSAKMAPAPDGGAVTTNDYGEAEHLRRLRDYGVNPSSEFPPGRANKPVVHLYGHNWRITTPSALMATASLDGVARWSQASRDVYDQIKKAVDARPGVSTQQANANATVAWHKVRLWGDTAEDTAALVADLEGAGVPTHRWGHLPLHHHPTFGRTAPLIPLSVTDHVAASSIFLGTEAIPPYTWTPKETEYVGEVIAGKATK